MQGCGHFCSHPRLYDHRILNFKDGKWQIAEEPLLPWVCKVWPDGGAGMAMSFGLALLQDNPDIKIGFVQCAVSGSSLDQWQPGADLFEKAVDQVKLALQTTNGTLAGFLWHQGEADSQSSENADTYQERFIKTIQGFRTVFDKPDLPIIGGELGRFLKNNQSLSFYEEVNFALQESVKQLPNAVFVNSFGLMDGDRHDNTHFDTLSLREFGKRYATAYLAL